MRFKPSELLVARRDTIRTILAIAASNDRKIYQLDVKSAFLHGELVEYVYVDQPFRYNNNKKKKKVYKLKKSIWSQASSKSMVL